MSEEKQQQPTEHASAVQVTTQAGRQYHIDLAAGEVSESILLVGDPARAERIAGLFDEIELRRAHREYLSITGTHQGLRVTAMGTGMGPASTEIAVVELAQITRAPVMIRCGSTGGLQADMKLGELAITQGCVRREQTSLGFVESGYPAFAHHEVVLALIQSAEEAGHTFSAGITATAAGFFAAQGRNIPGFPPQSAEVIDSLVRQGVRNLEMEASCLLTLASLRGIRAGAVCAVYATRHDNVFIGDDDRHAAEGRCIDTGLRALHHIASMDDVRGDRPHWHPGLG